MRDALERRLGCLAREPYDAEVAAVHSRRSENPDGPKKKDDDDASLVNASLTAAPPRRVDRSVKD